MAGLSKAKLLRDVKQWAYEGYHDEPLSVVELRHLAGRHNSQAVKAWKLAKDTDLESMVNEMEDAAINDAEGTEGTQKYAFLAFFGKNQNHSLRHPFVIYAPMIDTEGDETIISEPPTPSGIVSQLMRHKETEHRISAGTTGELLRILRNENDSQRDMIKEYQRNERLNIQAYQSLMNQQTLRDIETGKAKRRADFEDMIGKHVLLFLPTVVNRVTGQKLLPESTSPQQAMLAQFFDTLTEEQLGKLSTVLSPMQMAPVLELIKSHLDAKELKEKEEAAKLTGVAPVRQISNGA
jgi:hypothetical protein